MMATCEAAWHHWAVDPSESLGLLVVVVAVIDSVDQPDPWFPRRVLGVIALSAEPIEP